MSQPINEDSQNSASVLDNAMEVGDYEKKDWEPKPDDQVLLTQDSGEKLPLINMIQQIPRLAKQRFKTKLTKKPSPAKPDNKIAMSLNPA